MGFLGRHHDRAAGPLGWLPPDWWERMVSPVAKGVRAITWPARKGWSALPWPVRLALLALVLAGVGIFTARLGAEGLTAPLDLMPSEAQLLADSRLADQLEQSCRLCGWLGWAMLGAVVAAFVRRRAVLHALQVLATLQSAVWLWMLWVLLRVPARLHEIDPEKVSKFRRNEFWVAGVWAWVPVAILLGAYILCLLHRRVHEQYTRREIGRAMLGDRALAELACRGRDGEYRSSSYWSGLLHLAVFFLPFILRSCGMEEPYGIPKGSGVEVVQTIEVRRVKRKKKEQIVLNMDSPILFHVPDIEESKVLEELTEQTQETYKAHSDRRKIGKGGGKGGGWPDGMEGGVVRFIRLKYRGGDWDQDWDNGGGADYNMLLKLREMAGLPIAGRTEVLEIPRLRRFPKHRAPPFVYITGRGSIRLSSDEVRTLRWYCLTEGGMIFADNGGGSFDRSIRSVFRQVFPELGLVDIANDDILYKQPFQFPGGAPPLWHHSGDRALGIKHEGRWVVYYHQGDINDAWKTGHSGASPAKVMRAYKLGVNIIHYAFTEYLARHFQKK